MFYILSLAKCKQTAKLSYSTKMLKEKSFGAVKQKVNSLK